jgi:hypothetical protein
MKYSSKNDQPASGTSGHIDMSGMLADKENALLLFMRSGLADTGQGLTFIVY